MDRFLYVTLGVAVLLAAVYFVLCFPGVKKGRRIKDSLCVNYAHRGLWGGDAPENSLVAFDRAVKAGFGIELDVQLSRDGEVMVFHDYTLNRMTGGDGKLCDLTTDELGRLCLGGTNENIPTLREVLAVVDGRVPLLVELKGESLDAELCPKVYNIMKEYKGEYVVESFNPMLLRGYKKIAPEVKRGQLVTVLCKEKKRSVLNFLLDNMLFSFLARPDFVAFDLKHGNSAPIVIATGLWKLEKFVWTVRTREDVESAKKYNAKMIFEGDATEYIDREV